MTIANNITIRGKRFYPCPYCKNQHPSVSTLLDVIGSPALMGWMAKNGVAKLNVLNQVMEDHINRLLQLESYESKEIGVFLEGLRKNAEERWKLTEDTAFWKSGKETGQDAADVGTMAHAWLESHLKGVTVDLGALPPQAQNVVNAYLAWERDHKVKVIETEKTVYACKLDFAGTCDAILEIDGELTLCDWKSSNGIFSSYPIQLWSYALASEQSNHDLLYKQVMVGRFSKTGETEARIFKRNGFPGIEIARDIITSCGHIFKFNQTWEKENPFKRKEKKNETNATSQTRV